MARSVVTQNTERLLRLRKDNDYRIGIVYDVMFDDNIGGCHPERKFTVVDHAKNESVYILKKAAIYDGLTYEKIASFGLMKSTIENNILYLQNQKKNGTMAGMMPIKDVWIMLFTTNNKDPEVHVNTYFNPDANDCNEIIKSDCNIVMACFIISYSTKTSSDQVLPTGMPDEVYEYAFYSPMDEGNLDEYLKISLKEEAKELENMFLVEFDTSKLEK